VCCDQHYLLRGGELASIVVLFGFRRGVLFGWFIDPDHTHTMSSNPPKGRTASEASKESGPSAQKTTNRKVTPASNKRAAKTSHSPNLKLSIPRKQLFYDTPDEKPEDPSCKPPESPNLLIDSDSSNEDDDDNEEYEIQS
jgi:hypothetical protein